MADDARQSHQPNSPAGERHLVHDAVLNLSDRKEVATGLGGPPQEPPAGEPAPLGQSLDPIADEWDAGCNVALGNRSDAANVSDRPQSDLLAGSVPHD